MSDDPNEDPAAAADDPIVELPQSKLNQMMASARRQGRGERVEKPATSTAPAPQSAESIAAIVAATIQAMQPQQPRQPAPAAAPSAPSVSSLPTQNGLLNIFDPAVSRQLSPREMRTHLEKAWAIGAELSGAPSRPKPNR